MPTVTTRIEQLAIMKEGLRGVLRMRKHNRKILASLRRALERRSYPGTGRYCSLHSRLTLPA